MEDEPKSPVEQLVELMVYAPVGLLYEYPDVMDKLVTRGKSQVQLAKVLAQMAAKQGDGSAVSTAQTVGNVVATKAAGEFWQLVSKGVNEFNERTGSASPAEAQPAPGFPIEGYDDLGARDIIALLPDLTPAERKQVRAHEAAGRNRKTVIAKLDSLADG